MGDRAPEPPQAPIFNLNAYSPAEIQDSVETIGVKKATLPFLSSFMLSVIAGGSIGLGALYYIIVASDADLSFATIRVVGGLVFSLGLALVLVGGAELFTGNNLIVMAWASSKISTRQVLRNWTIVYCGNFVGSIGLVILVFFSHHLDMNGGRIGLTILNTAVAKISPDVVTLFFKGILCNVLVCLGVWLAYAGRSVTDKIVGLILPVSAFVAAGSSTALPICIFCVGMAARSRRTRFRPALTLPLLRYPGSSTISCPSRLAISLAAPASSALPTG